MWKTCNRGHTFQKSSDFPVCPVCWPGQKKKIQSDFPEIAAPALYKSGIKTLVQLSKKTESEILKLHGIGPKAIKVLKVASKK
jgi:hypothetical protein